jgi:tetratricopeptide (TPR) repeat protein
MRKACFASVVVALLFIGVPRAQAWGPRTQVAVVTTAARLLSKQSAIPLVKQDESIRSGASVSDATLASLIPDATTNPLAAIESEMYLLQAVRGDRVDPYLAYRLGVLGKLVAQATAPLLKEKSAIRGQYDADADRAVDRATITPRDRQLVDPPAYFALAQRQAAARQELVVKEYQSGLGFSGVAAQALSDDVSHSVNAVADVWHTILTGNMTVTNIAENQMRDYIVKALEFYIRRGRDAEIDAAYARFAALGLQTADLRKRIADMFYDTKQYERAIKEYRTVLTAAPGRRDAIDRIASYYLRIGDESIADNKLEPALAAYKQALEVDPLNPMAQEKKVDAEGRISARDARLGQARATIAAAKEFENRADQAALQGNYASALDLLLEAQRRYLDTGTEFLVESQAARAGLNNVASRLTQVKDSIIRGADRLSGGDPVIDARRLAAAGVQQMSRQALQALLASQRAQETGKFRQETEAKLKAALPAQPSGH